MSYGGGARACRSASVAMDTHCQAPNSPSLAHFAGVAVKFVIPYHCRFGQHLCIVGSVDKLGKWDVAKGLALNWSEGDVWRVEVDLPARWGPIASSYWPEGHRHLGNAGGHHPPACPACLLPAASRPTPSRWWSTSMSSATATIQPILGPLAATTR